MFFFFQPNGYKVTRGQTERIRQSESCLCSIMVWALLSCFKGRGPVPVCSNHNQMDGHITATEVACCLETHNIALVFQGLVPLLLSICLSLFLYFDSPFFPVIMTLSYLLHLSVSMLLVETLLSLLPPSIPVSVWCAVICRLSSLVGQLLISWTSHCPRGHPSIC